MTEVMTLHREMNGEEGEQCCVRYTLTAELCGRVQLYGVRCCVEGLPPQAERCKQIPAWLEEPCHALVTAQNCYAPLHR